MLCKRRRNLRSRVFPPRKISPGFGRFLSKWEICFVSKKAIDFLAVGLYDTFGIKKNTIFCENAVTDAVLIFFIGYYQIKTAPPAMWFTMRVVLFVIKRKQALPPDGGGACVWIHHFMILPCCKGTEMQEYFSKMIGEKHSLLATNPNQKSSQSSIQ